MAELQDKKAAANLVASFRTCPVRKHQLVVKGDDCRGRSVLAGDELDDAPGVSVGALRQPGRVHVVAAMDKDSIADNQRRPD